jgi:hypothetical protein
VIQKSQMFHHYFRFRKHHAGHIKPPGCTGSIANAFAQIVQDKKEDSPLTTKCTLDGHVLSRQLGDKMSI